METKPVAQTGVWVEDGYVLCWNVPVEMYYLYIRPNPVSTNDWVGKEFFYLHDKDGLGNEAGKNGRFDLRPQFKDVIEEKFPRAKTKGEIPSDAHIEFRVGLMPRFFYEKDPDKTPPSEPVERKPKPEEFVAVEWRQIVIADPNLYLPDPKPIREDAQTEKSASAPWFIRILGKLRTALNSWRSDRGRTETPAAPLSDAPAAAPQADTAETKPAPEIGASTQTQSTETQTTETQTTKDTTMNTDANAPTTPPTIPPPAPEKSPEEKLVDAQHVRLEQLKKELDPAQPQGVKPENQSWEYLTDALVTIKSIVAALRDPKFVNVPRAASLATETAELQKKINRCCIEKWPRWTELEKTFKNFNSRIRNLGCDEGQPGFALITELRQISGPLNKQNWDSLDPKALTRALSDAEKLREKLASTEDEVIVRAAKLDKELGEKDRALNDLRAKLQEALKKPAEQPGPSNPALAAAPAKSEVKQDLAPVAHPSHKQAALVTALTIAAIILLLINVMSLFDSRKGASTATPTEGAVTAMPPYLPWFANPRVMGHYHQLARSGALTGSNAWNSNSTMNGSSNYIGGDNLVNGSFMIKYMPPPTNPPIIVILTNSSAAASSAPGHCHPDREIKKKCSNDEPPIPGAYKTADGKWIREITLHPGEDAFEYRIDPDDYEVTYSYRSTADPALTVFQAIDSRGVPVSIPLGLPSHSLPAGTLGQVCGLKEGAGGSFTLTLVARPKTWNAAGSIQMAAMDRSK